MAAVQATVDELRDQLKAQGRAWYMCLCGRRIYEHAQRTIPSTGGREYICALRPTGRFEPVTLPELDYSLEKGVHRP